MKKTKLLKSIFIFSVMIPFFAFFGCASKQDIFEIEKEEITAPEEDESEESAAFTSKLASEEDNSEDEEFFQTEDDQTEPDLPEIEEPEIFDAELPEEAEEEPPVEIEEEKIAVEEVEPIAETEIDSGNESTDIQAEIDGNANQNIKPEIGIIVTDDEAEDVDEIEDVDDEAEDVDEVEDVDDVTTADDFVIDITDEEESLEEEVSEIEIIPSRSVTLRIGEYLEIDYPGKGWIFMGATDGSKNLTSAGRKLGDKDTNFTLLARNEGTSILHFYKEDVLAGVYIDDYIEVTVEPAKSTSKTKVKAPSYAETVPAKPSTTSSASPAQTSSAQAPVSPTQNSTTQLTTTDSQPQHPAQTSSAQAPVSPTQNSTTQPPTQTSSAQTELPSAADLLKSAKSKFDEKNYDSAKTDLELFLTIADNDRDEALYLLGQIYELNTKSKDIKKAIETYEKLMDNYPASKYWDDANKRVIYLKRFYINVR